MRIDAYLCHLGRTTRSKLRKIFRKTDILVNNVLCTDISMDVVDGDILDRPDIDIHGHIIRSKIYCILHKPKGYICSNINEGGHTSYRHLLTDCPMVNHLSCAGRLDVDTTGLVICSTDGQFVHRLISPRSHCPKTYRLTLENDINDEIINEWTKGIHIDDHHQTLPAKVERITPRLVHVTITEGKYHQIKRMCHYSGLVLIGLHRLSVGPFTLHGLEEGQRCFINDMKQIGSILANK